MKVVSERPKSGNFVMVWDFNNAVKSCEMFYSNEVLYAEPELGQIIKVPSEDKVRQSMDSSVGEIKYVVLDG